jgi:hypothetical protein
MVRSLAAALMAFWGTAAVAAGEELAIATKSFMPSSASAVSFTTPAKSLEAPFSAARPRDVLPEILLRQEMAAKAPAASGCETSSQDLCYDLREARIVYRRARAYMPEISGLRAESISLRHDRVVLKYTFR